ncbi:ATP-binding cassette domain-containing protein [Thermoleophilia bacterium SCSIO 60948]|nr:ATP-binding cassette domain-containing protein [Thermoleophilia bacterium SCSIO 60948]
MIEIEGLTKRYGREAAASDVSFSCEPGTVTGFLGPNGAGKSTTLRMLCGLTRPDGGTSRVLDTPYVEIPNPGRHVGVMLDASAQHQGRSGRETLELIALTIGVPRAGSAAMLERVGLDAKAASRRVGDYSLGMRQRLGIAGALVGSPSVLILDEPANGLDPAGIVWMRGLLRDFADRGGTVLLSSHLLHEVEAVADQLVLINHGRVVAQGSKAELLAASGTVVRANDLAGLERVLGKAEIGVERIDGHLVADAEAALVGEVANAGGIALSELRGADGGGLEGLFMSLTESGAGDRAGEEQR